MTPFHLQNVGIEGLIGLTGAMVKAAMRAFAVTAEAICRTILVRRFGAPAAADTGPVARFVIEQHARMPDYLRWAMLLATLAFDWWGLCSAGACFSHLPARRRQAQIEAWRTAPAAPARDFVRFYDSLVVFCRHSLTPPDLPEPDAG